MLKSIGDFEVKAELGHGGMGRVYRAYDPKMERDVAIKILTNEADPDLLVRFRKEAGTTAKLIHPNIVTVHAYGQHEDVPYLVMELLEGDDLARIIRERRPLSLLDKLDIMRQVAEGLSFAHQNKVIHRDIKPSNIIVLRDGSVKILDFGIARVTGSDSTRRTQAGFLVGTVSYMAPEQFRAGHDADELVDIFAYGDVFYELLAGHHPFEAPDPGAVIYRITNEEPKPIRELSPECPDSLAYLVHVLLSKDRDLRYRSLRDLLLDLEPELFRIRSERAAEIVAAAQPLIDDGQEEAAMLRLSEALQLDPGNAQAKELRGELQRKSQARAVRAKVAAANKEAADFVAQNNLPAAIEVLKNVMKLGPNEEVQQQLTALRRQHEGIQRARQLLAEARRELQRGHLDTAEARVSEALSCDPNNAEAATLAPQIHERLRQRDVQLTNAIAEVREVMEAGDLQKARTAITDLSVRFGMWSRADEQRAMLLEELAEREEDAYVTRAIGQMDVLIAQRRFGEAQSLLDNGLNEYPRNLDLQMNRIRLASVKGRAEAIERTVEEIERLRQADLDAALQASKGACAAFPEHSLFTELVPEIEVAIQERNRLAAIGDAVRRATALLASDPSQAVELLRQTREQTGEDRGLDELLAKAERAVIERAETQAVEQILAKARAFHSSQQSARALEELERGTSQFPGRPELPKAAAEIRDELARLARAEKLRTAARAIEQALAARDWQRAGQLVAAARKEFPGEPQIEQLAARLERDRRTAIEAVIGRATALLASEPVLAVELLRQARGQTGEDRGLDELLAKAERAAAERAEQEAVEQILAQARSLHSSRQSARALEELERGMNQFPGRPELPKAATEIRDELARLAREDKLRTASEAIEQGLAARDWQRAGQLIAAAHKEFPGEPQIEQLAATLQRGRRSAIEDAIGRATALLDPDPSQAVALLRRTREQTGEDRGLDELLAKAERAAAQRAEQDAVEQILAQARALHSSQQSAGALEELERGMSRFPGRPELLKAAAEIRDELARLARAELLNRVSHEIQQLLESGDWQRADQQITAARSAFPREPQIEQLATKLQQGRGSAIEKAIRRANELLDSDPSQAFALLRRTREQTGEDRGLDELLAKAERAAAQRAEQEAVDGILERAFTLHGAKQSAQAMVALERGILQFPAREELQWALSEIREELARLARAEKLGAATQAIEQALTARDWRRAAQLIDSARGEFSGEPQIEQLSAKLTQTRREAIEEAMRRATALLDSDPSQALVLLRQAREQTGPEADLDNLLAKAQRAAAERAEQKAVAQILERARTLHAAQRGAQAIEVLEQGMTKFPAREELRRALVEIQEELARLARAERLRSAVQAIEQALAAPDWRRADELIDSARGEYSGEPQIERLAVELQRERRSAIEDSIRRATALLDSDPSQAVALLRRAREQTDPKEGLDKLLAEAERVAAERAEQVAVAQILERARTLHAAHQSAQALGVLARGLTQFPAHEELERTSTEINKDLQRALRVEKLRSVTEAIERTLAARDWRRAAILIDQARSEFAEEAQIERLATQLAESRRGEEWANLAASARRSLAKNDLQGAQQKLAAAALEFDTRAEWLQLNQEVELYVDYQAALARAHELSEQAQFDQADQVLNSWKDSPAWDKRAKALLRVIAKKRARAEGSGRSEAGAKPAADWTKAVRKPALWTAAVLALFAIGYGVYRSSSPATVSVKATDDKSSPSNPPPPQVEPPKPQEQQPPVNLGVNRHDLEFEFQEGRALPTPQPILVTGANPDLVQISSQENWLSIARGKKPNEFEIGLKASGLRGLRSGPHTAEVILTFPGALNSPQRVTVSLLVRPAFILPQ